MAQFNRLTIINTSLNNLSLQQSDMNKKITNIDGTINSLNSSVNNIYSSISTTTTSNTIINNDTSDILIYGYDGITNKKVLTDNTGKIIINVNETNNKLDTANTNLTNIETNINDTNTKLDTANTNLTNIETNINDTNTKLDTANTNLTNIETNINDTNTKLDTANTNLTNIETNINDTNNKLDTANTNIQKDIYINALNIYNNNFYTYSSRQITISTGIHSTAGAMVGGSISQHIIPLTSAETFNIISSDIDDTNIGTGLRKIYIEGLDNNYTQQYEIVSLDGITLVNTSKQYIHINKLAPYETGSTNVAQGNIDVKRNNDNQLYGRITGAILFGTTLMETSSGFFMVPKNTKAILSGLTFTATNTTNILLIVYRARPTDDTTGPITRPYEVITRYQNISNLYISNHPIVVLNEKDCIYIFNTNSVEASASMTFSLYDFNY